MYTLSEGWKLAIDPGNIGREERWFDSIQPAAVDAPVPGIIQRVFPAYHGVAWYWNSFRLPKPTSTGSERVWLRFGAVDYLADVWVNGKYIGSHEGGETPFEFDITDSLLSQGDHLLAVRVFNPTDESIDGIKLVETPHRNKVAIPRSGSSFDSGGIMYPVQLRFLPPVHIADVFARPDLAGGAIAVSVMIRNTGGAMNGKLTLGLAPASGGGEITNQQETISCPSGRSVHELRLTVTQPRPWNLDDPFLYRITTTVSTDSQRPHQNSVCCGFRDLRVIDGWFSLNGKRIFLKSTHTGNHMPIGQQVAVLPDFVRRDLINAKAAGFNCVRFISGIAFPEQLDFCDEIGLMVYEECFASWLLADSPQMAERFERSTSDMILRDRNHPSVAIWGLLNETSDGPVFRQAAAFLPSLRKLDPTRLVLLSSGRWDGQWSIGSASNPGSDAWEYVWGEERPDGPTIHGNVWGYVQGAGDVHTYPSVPHTPATESALRTLGLRGKPVFLSEYGIGSMFDVIREGLHFEQTGARPDLEDGAWLKRQSESLKADWARLGFDDVYPFPEDLLRESQRLHARQRSLGFNLVRSNPRISGYNLTGMLDHGMTGEGLWTFWREWKPSTFDAVSDGWTPLRWCLFADPMHGYNGRDITLEAVLANEEVLKPGEFPARFRLFGPSGVAWEKTATVTVPESNPFAIQVIRETVKLDGPAGQYTFAATLERGGAPTGGRLVFTISDPASLPSLCETVATWGIDARARDWLGSHGVSAHPIETEEPMDTKLIVVGLPDDPTKSNYWDDLMQNMDSGATVLFLCPSLFIQHPTALAWLPLKNKGRCYTFADWLYHKECVARRHPVFAGLAGPGIMDMDYYGPVIPHEVFMDIDTPDDTIAAAFSTGYYDLPGGYGCSIQIGAWKYGKGRFILSTPYLLENLDHHPAADRLLLNLIAYAAHG